MACDTTLLRGVPFFALFDDEELTVLAAQVDLRTFAARQREKVGDLDDELRAAPRDSESTTSFVSGRVITVGLGWRQGAP